MALRLTKLLTILNAERLATSLAEPHTIAITGLPRGGTSAVALVLRELGLFMGDAPIDFNHEDKRLQDARNDPAAFAAIARDYDARHRNWGFKLPVGARMLGELAPRLRNPILIAVSRNLATVVRSRHARRKIDDQAIFLRELRAVHVEWQRFTRQAEQCPAPLMLVEYERFTADPARLVDELVDALALPADEGTRARAAHAVAAPGYQRFSGDPDQSSLAKPAIERRLFR